MPIGKDSITKRVAKVDKTEENIAPELVATTAAAPKKTPAKKTTTTTKKNLLVQRLLLQSQNVKFLLQLAVQLKLLATKEKQTKEK